MSQKENDLIAIQAHLAEALLLIRDAKEGLRTGPDYGWEGRLANQLGEFLARHAQAKQQEAQGAQAGDERAAFECKVQDLAERFQPDYRRYGDAGEYKDATLEWAWKLWQARAAQPAAGDPIQVEVVAVTREDEDGLYLDWVLEGGISALEAPGVVLLVAHGTVTDKHGNGEVYLAPPAAAHGDEAVEVIATLSVDDYFPNSGVSHPHLAFVWEISPQRQRELVKTIKEPIKLVALTASPAVADGDDGLSQGQIAQDHWS